MRIAAGVDLGGTAVNYTFVDREGHFLIDGLCEHPARSKEGPAVCLQQITDGLEIAARQAGVTLADVAMIGLDTPGPASADGVLSVRGSTNFVHADWAGFDLRHGLEEKVGKPVVYLNDGNAAALWGHVAIFGPVSDATSISAIIGTGLGGGVITGGNTVVRGRRGFGGELGHILVPYQSIAGIEGLRPECNCLRTGDLESLCSLTAIERTILPYFLARDPHHELHKSATPHEAAKRVRGLAERGDALCRRVFQVQAHALGLFFDEMVNVFDPDAFIVGGGAIETGKEFQQWFLDEVRRGMPTQRSEQAGIPIHIMPNGDSAGARGAAIEAMGRMRTG
jgi:predicted NBD/HSP70 family sugar kinase